MRSFKLLFSFLSFLDWKEVKGGVSFRNYQDSAKRTAYFIAMRYNIPKKKINKNAWA